MTSPAVTNRSRGDSNNFASLNSGVYASAPGVLLALADFPADLATAPDGDKLTELGFMSDGLTVSHSMDSDAKFAWQGGVNLKTIKQNEVWTVAFEAVSERAFTMGIIRPGSTTTATADLATTIVGSATDGDVRSYIIDVLVAPGKGKRWLVPQAEVTEFGDSAYVAGELTVYPATLTMYFDDTLGGFYKELSNLSGMLTEDVGGGE